MVRSNSHANYQGGTITLRRNFQQGYTLQGAYTFGKAMNDADIAVGTTNFQDAADIGADYAIAGYDVPHKLALARRVGDAVLQGQHRPDADAARRLADRRLGDPAGRQPDQRHQRRGVSDRRLQRRRQRRRSAERAGERREDERLEQSTSTSPASSRRQRLPGAGARARTAISCATPIADPGYADVSLSLSKRFAMTTKINTEVRVDAFNALNRVNLDNPVTDLSNTNFGKSRRSSIRGRSSSARGCASRGR